MCTISVYIHDLRRKKMDPVRPSALTPHHIPSLTSGKGIADQTFAANFTNLANTLSGFFPQFNVLGPSGQALHKPIISLKNNSRCVY
jgi:hypothetical protein